MLDERVVVPLVGEIDAHEAEPVAHRELLPERSLDLISSVAIRPRYEDEDSFERLDVFGKPQPECRTCEVFSRRHLDIVCPSARGLNRRPRETQSQTQSRGNQERLDETASFHEIRDLPSPAERLESVMLPEKRKTLGGPNSLEVCRKETNKST